MIEPSEIEYKRTKLIKQGKCQIEKRFKSLTTWISEKYEVTVLDIQEEYLKHNKKVRISIHVESEDNSMVFRNGNDWWSDFDSNKQNT